MNLLNKIFICLFIIIFVVYFLRTMIYNDYISKTHDSIKKKYRALFSRI